MSKSAAYVDARPQPSGALAWRIGHELIINKTTPMRPRRPGRAESFAPRERRCVTPIAPAVVIIRFFNYTAIGHVPSPRDVWLYTDVLCAL
ncbi:hypothetical protein EVAR_5673_1 [Eumeta japonica]|uniref:Uncharacterized protein n=1 Tax=Eumeta variegata TaxID=151549 RepID=A0A4C1T7G7_EUMVA|nr:hypothetical protein EVAR_5673_1 [Eumeta japonica]